MTGPWLVLLGRGRGDAEVDPSPYVARSHGREVTFQKNIKEWDQVQTEIARLARQVAAEVEERPVARAVVKVRYAPFTTVTHGAPFAAPGNAALDPAGFEAAARAALAQFTPGRPVRLLGVRAEFAKDPADD
jgi:transposase